jgi:exodeoxyribonuclease VII small subunit
MGARQKSESFETHLAKLEEIVDALESGDLELETALQRYEEGVRRLKSCYELLARAEQKVSRLVGESELEPFEPEDDEA